MSKRKALSVSSPPQTSHGLQVLLSADQIADKIKELAQEIRADYADTDFTIVIVLKGAFVFAADLIRQIDIPMEIDFIRATSYRKGTCTSGEVNIRLEPDSIIDRDVLLVEDIVDTGLTLDCVKRRLMELGAKSVRICTLLDKPSRRCVDIDVEYRGFVIPDVFVCGYGIDYAEKGREFSDVCVAEVNENEKDD